MQYFLNFLHRNGLFEVAFIGVEEVRNVRGNKFVFYENFDLASGHIESHFVGTVDNENDAADFVFAGIVGSVCFPEVSVLGLAGHVNDFDVDLLSGDGVFFETDGWGDVGVERVRVEES